MKSSIDGWALTVCLHACLGGTVRAWIAMDIVIGIGISSYRARDVKVLVWSGMAKQGRKGRHLALGPGTQTGQGQEPQRRKTTYQA
ncbi:hypothetical protein PgNI_06221 [Pyricularia grisea]|uniref:Uncharacterized protein n=1 Tax=Pyricularia grisea TaxID=148305 RepID=A0A6P8B8E7_PYRGI|nr:hypothetical protein PgNI_06221 [Pyricularia grisea]TLD11389.1 hypothetical protein PgNI_06221 [Pyricularia grisea]